MVNTHRQDILISTEIQVGKERMAQLVLDLPFDRDVASDTMGHRGGNLVMWHKAYSKVRTVGSTEQEIHILVQVRNSKIS